MKNTLFGEANAAFKKKLYIDAISLYKKAMLETPELGDIISQNISIAEKKGGISSNDIEVSNNVFNENDKEKVIVYTCNFGQYEAVKEPLFIDPNVEYILFTDDKSLTSKYWKVVFLEEALDNPRRTSRLPKIMAHKYLPPHDISVYIDSSLEIKVKNVQEMVNECLEGFDMALYKHYERDCVYDEIDFVMNHSDRIVSNRELCERQIKKYNDINYPRKNGLYENAFIVRRNVKSTRELNEIWWREYTQGAERDQFVLMYALNFSKVKSNVIRQGGNFRESPYVNFYKHKYIPYFKKPKIAIVVHVYYIDVWDKIKEKLLTIEHDYKLFITSSPEKCALLKPEVESLFNNVSFLSVENKGMDVLPFLKAIDYFKLDQYDTVLKLHTKNEKSLTRKLQGDIILSSLINSYVIDNVFSSHNDPVAIFPGFFTRSIKGLMYANRKIYSQLLCALYGFEKQMPGDYFAAGTMFWLPGKYLAILRKNMYVLEPFFNSSYIKYSTGGDATPAHALERLFGGLVENENLKLSFRIDSKNENYELISASESGFLSQEIVTADSLDHLNLFETVDSYASTLAKSEIFDEKYYLQKVNQFNFFDFDTAQSPASNAILYGEPLGIDPSKNFSVNFYKIINKDVLKNRRSVIGHYLSTGKNEGRKFYPTYIDVIDCLHDFHFIAHEDKHNNIVPVEYSNEVSNLLSILDKTFDKSQSISLEAYQSFEIILSYVVSCYKKHCYLIRLYKNADFVEFSRQAILFYEKYKFRKESLEAISISYLLKKRFSDALFHYEKLWDLLNSKNRSSNYLFDKIPYDQAENTLVNRNIFQTVTGDPKAVSTSHNKKICIYTSLYGDRDELPPILTKTDNVEYICFSDRDHPNSDWNVLVVPAEYSDNNLNAKRFKILPHKYLKDYDASIFIDANTYCYGIVEELISCYLIQHNFVMFAHPARDDIYKEVATIIAHRRHRPLEIIQQLESYFYQGLPHNSGMVEGSFIWRTHNNHLVNSFMEEWWSHIVRYSKRDQISLGYLMWKNNFRPKILPKEVGDSRENVYFKKYPHQKAITLNKEEVREVNREVVFVYNEKFKRSGSTVMRGFQLYDLINKEFNNNKLTGVSDISVAEERELSSIKCSILFLTKGVLSSISIDTLSILKRNENIILADFVDAKINSSFVPFFDIIIAASISAFIAYRNSYPNKKVSLLTHHVDPRVEKICSNEKSKKSKAGYFGELVNTLKNKSIEKYVDFYSIDTSGTVENDSWITNISDYEYHYLIRRERRIDGFKPFTKGFTSACAHAYPILSSNTHDAKYYLGLHYPFYISSSEDSISLDLDKIICGSFVKNKNNADFYIHSLRSRSDYEFIVAEFKRILSCAVNL